MHACMYSHQVSNSNGGLAPKIGLLLVQSWMVTSMGLVLGQSLIVMLTTGILLYAKAFPLYHKVQYTFIGMDEALAHYACTFKNSHLQFHFE